MVVWLGVDYSKFQDKLSALKDGRAECISVDADSSTQNALTDVSVGSQGSADEQEMVKQLCRDPYWNRLWIIQEIGQAHRLKVCFGRFEKHWRDFIDSIRLHQKDGRPIILDNLRKERNINGYRLRNLLLEHQGALCKEPQDKVYGLVGLAGDAYGFPMGYNRTLMQVWVDTMEFLNEEGLAVDSDLIRVGRVVKSLLFGERTDPLDLVHRPNVDGEAQETQDIELINDSKTPCSPKVFEIGGHAFGCISHLGPSTSEIVADLSQEEEWGKSFQTLYKKDLGSAQSESRMLIRSILSENAEQISRKCHNYISSVVWNPVEDQDRHSWIKSFIDRNSIGQHLIQEPLPLSSTDIDGSSDPRLYQVTVSWLGR